MNNINEYIESLPITFRNINKRTGIARMDYVKVQSVAERNLTPVQVVEIEARGRKMMVRYAEDSDSTTRASQPFDIAEVDGQEKPARRFERKTYIDGRGRIDMKPYINEQLTAQGYTAASLDTMTIRQKLTALEFDNESEPIWMPKSQITIL